MDHSNGPCVRDIVQLGWIRECSDEHTKILLEREGHRRPIGAERRLSLTETSVHTTTRLRSRTQKTRHLLTELRLEMFSGENGPQTPTMLWQHTTRIIFCQFLDIAERYIKHPVIDCDGR